MDGLPDMLEATWVWLSADHMEKLKFVGGGFIAIIGALWLIYQHFSKKKENSGISASSGGIAIGENVSATTAPGASINIATGNVTIKITLEQYEEDLIRKEQEVRSELREANAADKEKIVLLEKQFVNILGKLKNPESALADYKAKLAQAYNALDDLKREVLPEHIKQAQDVLIEGQTADAEELFIQGLMRGTENAAKAAYQLCQLAHGRIDYETADHYCQQAVDLQPDNPLYLNAAGSIAYTMGQYVKAEPFYQRVLAIREKSLGPNHPDVAQCLNNLAELYRAQGQYGKAEPLYQQELAIWEKSLGPDHSDVAQCLNNLAELYRAQEQYGKAEPLHQRALAIREKSLGPDHPDVAQSLNNLAMLYYAQGQYGKAEPLYQWALAIWEDAFDPDHPHVAQTLNNLAMLYRKQGRNTEAEVLETHAKANSVHQIK